MANVIIERFGHYRDTMENSDKIWGLARVEGPNGGTVFSFWGRRGGHLSYQEIPGGMGVALSKWSEKVRKGYVDHTRNPDAVYGGTLNYVVTYLIDALVNNKVTKAKWAS